VRQVFLAIFLLTGLVHAEGISPSKYAKFVQKGEKIASKLCDANKLSTITGQEFEQILQQIDKINPCITLNTRNKEALAYFLIAGHTHHSEDIKEQIEVPKKVKCPVCGMFVVKYPKWVALIDVDGKNYYFDGVKDMMKFYIFDVDFPYDRKTITQIKVTDFYTLQSLDAKQAFYVIGSDVFGPMGNELIPFRTKKAAENFMSDHRGEKIIRFYEISPELVMGLDGLEFTE
jgi:nitrous oxide reductase accessory protein NosL